MFFRKRKLDEIIWEAIKKMPGALICVTDKNFRLVWANDYFYEFFSCEKERIIGASMHDFLGDDSRRRQSEEHVERLLKTGYAWERMGFTTNANGDDIAILWNQLVTNSNKEIRIISFGNQVKLVKTETGDSKSQNSLWLKSDLMEGETPEEDFAEPIALQDFITERELLDGLEAERLEMFYQPRVNVKAREIVGAEALMRFRHPKKGLLTPGQFMPTAKNAGIMQQIDSRALEMVCKKIREWDKQTSRPLNVSVNISHHQMLDATFPQKLLTLLNQTEVLPGRIMLDVAEKIIAQYFDAIVPSLKSLRAAGFIISIDDYNGNDLPALKLLELNAHNITIDRFYLVNVGEHPAAYTIIESLTTLARGLDMSVTAAGIENPEHLEKLQHCGVDFLQGYLFSKPLSESDFDRFIRSNPDFYTRHI